MRLFKSNKKKNPSPHIILFKNPFRQKKCESITKFFAKLNFLKKNILYFKLQKFRLKSAKVFFYEKLKKQIIKIKVDLFFIQTYDIF